MSWTAMLDALATTTTLVSLGSDGTLWFFWCLASWTQDLDDAVHLHRAPLAEMVRVLRPEGGLLSFKEIGL